MSQSSSVAPIVFILLVLSVTFGGLATYFHGPVPVEQIEVYELKTNPNPVSESAIPENASITNYRTLNYNETTIAHDIVGGDDMEHGTSKPHKYTYSINATDKPAEKFASSDYLQYDNIYYPIFSSIETYESPSYMAILQNHIALCVGAFSVFLAVSSLCIAVTGKIRK